MSLWSSLRRGWRALKGACRGIATTIEDSFLSLKKDLCRYWSSITEWLSQPRNRNRLIVQAVKYSVFVVLFGGTLVLVLGPQAALVAGAWVGVWKLAEWYWGPFPFEKWFGRCWPLVRFAALGFTGLIWTAAEWIADSVSAGVQKIMEYFGAEF